MAYCVGIRNRFVLTPELKCLPITPFMNDDYRCFTMLLTMCDIEFANSHLLDTTIRILQHDLYFKIQKKKTTWKENNTWTR